MKEEQQRDRLLGSLKRGNLQLVNLEGEDAKESVYLAANPQCKKLDVYDREMKEVYQKREESREIVAEVDVLLGGGGEEIFRFIFYRNQTEAWYFFIG